MYLKSCIYLVTCDTHCKTFFCAFYLFILIFLNQIKSSSNWKFIAIRLAYEMSMNCLSMSMNCQSVKCVYAYEMSQCPMKCLSIKCLSMKCLSMKCLSMKCLSMKCLSMKCLSMKCPVYEMSQRP